MSDQADVPAVRSLEEQVSVAAGIISRIKSSVVFDNNFNAALIYIPNCLQLLANANIYASLPVTDNVMVGDIVDHELFLSFTLKGCLKEVVNACQTAFRIAETELGLFPLRGKVVLETLSNDIFEGLKELEQRPAMSTLRSVQIGFDTIKTAAEQVHDDTTKVANAFNKVLLMVDELARVIAEKGSLSSVQAKQAQMKVYTNTVQLTNTELAEKSAREAVDKAKQVVDTTRMAYEKASNDYPTTMQVMGASVVMSLTDCLTSMVTQIVPSVVNNMNMANKIGSGVKSSSKSATGLVKEIKGDNDNDLPDPSPAKQPDYATDPAFQLAWKDRAYIVFLSNIICAGKDEGVDWPGVSNVDFLVKQIEEAYNDPTLTKDPPSVTLKETLNDASRVGHDVLKEVKENSAYAKLGKDSGKVQDWQKRIKLAASGIAGLCSQSSALPGTGGSMGAMKQPEITSQQKLSATNSTAKTLLDGAAHQLDTASKSLTSTMDTYTTLSNKLVDVQVKLGTLRGEIAQFKAEEKTLNEVLVIISLITAAWTDFKTEINKIILHFNALQKLVDFLYTTEFSPFMKRLQNRINDNDAAITVGLGNIDDDYYSRHSLYVAGCTLGAYFTVFAGVGKNYTEISQTVITNSSGGMHLIDQCGNIYETTYTHPGDTLDGPEVADPTGADYDPKVQAEILRRKSMVKEYNESATEFVQKKVDQVNKEQEAKLKSQMNEVQSKIKELPIVDKHIAEGTTRGVQTVSGAIKKAIAGTTHFAVAPNAGRGTGPIKLDIDAL